MAQRTTVVLLDDLDATPADQTLEFGLDGVAYEIDLTDAHAESLRDELEPYLARARRVGSGGVRRTTEPPRRRAPSAPAVVDREQNRAIRDWATRHGHPLSPRGRIPAAVTEAFHRGDPAELPTTSTGAAGSPASLTDAPASPPDAPAPPEDTPAARVGPDGLTGDERERIRAWAIDEGIEVKTRGRLTKDLIANYRAVQARR